MKNIKIPKLKFRYSKILEMNQRKSSITNPKSILNNNGNLRLCGDL